MVPRANRTELAGKRGDAIHLRVAAPPVDGAANEEVIRFLAKRLGVTRSAVAITRGEASRSKTVTVLGLSTDAALARLMENG